MKGWGENFTSGPYTGRDRGLVSIRKLASQYCQQWFHSVTVQMETSKNRAWQDKVRSREVLVVIHCKEKSGRIQNYL